MSENIYIQFLVIVLCYLIGSFPSAYLLVKKKHNADITREGSGNVGTYNAIVVSKSKTTGAAVLLIDLLKGAITVFAMLFVFQFSYAMALIGAVFLVVGHNYPVWLKFKGGRGLAVGAGIFIIVNYYVLIGWCVIWILFKLIKADVLVANTFATLSIFIWVFLINKYSWLEVNYNIRGFLLSYFTLFTVIITVLILLSHLEVFSNFFKNKSNT